LPGVERVAGVMGLPTGNYGSNGYYETRGGLPMDADHPAWSHFSVASPGYFGTMGIPLKHGRDFGSEDTHESGMVAVISESLARQSFGDADPVGKQIRCGLDSDKWMTVVGVVGECAAGVSGGEAGSDAVYADDAASVLCKPDSCGAADGGKAADFDKCGG
jgi:putative ABC transport system permease protein